MSTAAWVKVPSGPRKAILSGILLRQAGRHDLAEQPQHFFVAQGRALFLVALQRQAQHLRFALRAVVVDGMARSVLRDPDLLRQQGALVDAARAAAASTASMRSRIFSSGTLGGVRWGFVLGFGIGPASFRWYGFRSGGRSIRPE